MSSATVSSSSTVDYATATSSVQANAIATGNAAAMGSMHISGSPGAVFGAVGSIGSVIINPAPNSSSSTSTTTTEAKDRLNDVKADLCKFYSHQNNIANFIDGKEFPIIKVQLSLVTERCEEKNTRDSASAQDSKDANAKSDANKYREDWYQAKQTIEVEKLFELTEEEQKKDNRTAVRKLANKVRVVGPAGIGKTTFTQYVAYKWATDGLWNDRFKYVFWIKLRNLVQYADEKDPKLSYIIFKECLADVVTEIEEDNCKENIKIILDKQREQTLLILDGYDEITGLLTDTTKSTKGIFNKFKFFPNLILTSRPYRLDGLHDITFDRKLENCGFSSEQIVEYIDNYFADQKGRAKEMKAWLEPREMVMGLAHIPVNLNILCALSDRFIKPEAQTIQTSSDTKDSKESKDVKAEQILIVTTIIEADEVNLVTIYQEMVSYFLYNHYLIPNHYVTENDIVATETDRIEMKCASELSYLGNLALKALHHEGQTIVQQDIFAAVDKETDAKELDRIKNPVLKMGLLRAIDNRGIQDRLKPYEFLHFSFQEFLAARYLVQLLKSAKTNESEVDVARKFFRTEKYNPNYYMVFNFAAGLVHLENETILQAFWQELLNEPRDLTGLGHIGLMIRCLNACMLDKRIPNLDSRIKEIQQWLQTIIYDNKNCKSNFIFSRIFDYYFIPTLKNNGSLLISNICDEVFTEALGNKEADVIRIADLYAIRGIDEKVIMPESIRPSNTVLGAKGKNIRMSALRARRIKPAMSESIRPSSPVLGAKEKNIRMSALRARRIKPAIPESIRPRSSVLKTKEKNSRISALCAIEIEPAWPKNIRPSSPVEVEEDVGEYMVVSVLSQIKPSAGIMRWIGNILQQAEEENVKIKEALFMVQKIGEKAAMPEIMIGIAHALEMKEVSVKEAALCAICGIGAKAATPDILTGINTALDAKEWRIRKAALKAIKRIGAKAATPEILTWISAALESKDWHIRTATLRAIQGIGEEAAIPKILNGIAQALDASELNIIQGAAIQAMHAIGANKTTPEILAKVIFNLKIHANYYGWSDYYDYQESTKAINYLLSVSLRDILSKYLNATSEISAHLIVNLALLQNKAITITATNIQIYDSRQTYTIPLPKQADIKEQRIVGLKQAFGLEPSQDETAQLNSAERLLKIVTTNENYTQTVSSAASSSLSSFFSSSSGVVSSSSSLTTTVDTLPRSTTVTVPTAFSCSAAQSESAKVAAQENILRAAQLNLRENQNHLVPSVTASSSASSFSSSRRYVFVPRIANSNSSATMTTTTNAATVASYTDASALGATTTTTITGNALKNS